MAHRPNPNALHQARKAVSPPLRDNGDYQTEKSIGANQDALLAVGVDSFFTDLPPSSLVPFVRNRLWVPDPSITNNFPLSGPTAQSFTTAFNLFEVPENQSLLLTFVAQTWLTSTVPAPPTNTNTVYTALPTTAGASGVAPLQITINQNPIADAAGLYNDANWQTNVFNFGNGLKVYAIIPEKQTVGALYTATYSTAVNATERPDAIRIVCKGYLAPTKVIQKARRLYGI
jgi:hypothetical protein